MTKIGNGKSPTIDRKIFGEPTDQSRWDCSIAAEAESLCIQFAWRRTRTTIICTAKRWHTAASERRPTNRSGPAETPERTVQTSIRLISAAVRRRRQESASYRWGPSTVRTLNRRPTHPTRPDRWTDRRICDPAHRRTSEVNFRNSALWTVRAR